MRYEKDTEDNFRRSPSKGDPSLRHIQTRTVSEIAEK